MFNQMNYPPVNELEQKIGCRYMLVTTVAKRARQILVSREKDINTKPVSSAVEELYEGKLDIEFPPEYYQTSEK